MIILRRDITSNINLEQRIFGATIPYEHPKKNRVATLDLTNPNTFRQYQSYAEQAAQKQALKDAANAKATSKGAGLVNKAAKRQEMIERGSYSAARKTGVSRESILNNSVNKLTRSNPDWNNPAMNSAQEIALQTGRRRSQRGLVSVKDSRRNRVTGDVLASQESLSNLSGDRLKMEMQERWKKLSPKTKALAKQRQAEAKKVAEVESLRPKTKTERIQALSGRGQDQFKDKNARRLYGKSRNEVRFDRFKSREGDVLEGKNAKIVTKNGKIIDDKLEQSYYRSKEFRKSRLSAANQEKLKQSNLRRELEKARANNQMPALISKPEIKPLNQLTNTTNPTVKVERVVKPSTPNPPTIRTPEVKVETPKPKVKFTPVTTTPSTPKPKARGFKFGKGGKIALGTALLGGTAYGMKKYIDNKNKNKNKED